MLFIKEFTHNITLSPSDLGKDLKKIIKIKLINQVTGTCNEKFGYYIKVINIGEIKNGFILEGSGNIIFKMTYKVVLLRPFKNEVSDGIVHQITGGNILVKVGPMVVFIEKNKIPQDFEYDAKNECYKNKKDSSDIIKVGEKVRFKYIEIQYSPNEFRPIGTMFEKYLGHIKE